MRLLGYSLIGTRGCFAGRAMPRARLTSRQPRAAPCGRGAACAIPAFSRCAGCFWWQYTPSASAGGSSHSWSRLSQLADATLADEPGCLTFEVHAPVAGDDAASETHELLLYERYASQAAANAHSRTPTFEELSPSIVDTDEPPGMRLEGKITEGLSAPPPAHVVSVTTMGVGFVACREDDEGRTGKVPAGQTVLVVDLEFASKEDFALWRSRFQEVSGCAALGNRP